jgi:hypothetical protein
MNFTMGYYQVRLCDSGTPKSVANVANVAFSLFYLETRGDLLLAFELTIYWFMIATEKASGSD